jgi:pyridoxine 5-phosphate synthase
MKLGVNIDHIATIRQARGTIYPNIVQATKLAEKAGADSITLHLREDRRHMQDQDLFDIKPVIQTKMNLEMAATEEMLRIALKLLPEDVCIVPERREERTTEGGLDLVSHFDQIANISDELHQQGIQVSLFIAPDFKMIDLASKMKVPVIELHTGAYADSNSQDERDDYLLKLKQAAEYAKKLGIQVNAGHGLNYDNIFPILDIKEITELNIGHAIVSEALFIGWDAAIRKMKMIVQNKK